MDATKSPYPMLVVDDKPSMRRLLEEAFGARGFAVTTASNGIEAIECIQKQDFAVVITDLSMPGKDGIEVLKAAKQVHSDRLAIIGNSSSMSLLATDTLYRFGGRLAQFSEATQQGLEPLIEPSARPNPVDLSDQANVAAYGRALDGRLLTDDMTGNGVVSNAAISYSYAANGALSGYTHS